MEVSTHLTIGSFANNCTGLTEQRRLPAVYNSVGALLAERFSLVCSTIERLLFLFRLAIRLDDHPATAAVNTQSMRSASES
ncbi:MAG: hypothetical protein ACJ05G_06875 [Actinomycetota bacterium]|nr:hypothetical protein [Acidimicrobiales bacterium]